MPHASLLMHAVCFAAAEDTDKGRQAASGKVRKAITRATREHAAMVHRSCALCLVGRALLYDKALQDEELQVGAKGAVLSSCNSHDLLVTVSMDGGALSVCADLTKASMLDLRSSDDRQCRCSDRFADLMDMMHPRVSDCMVGAEFIYGRSVYQGAGHADLPPGALDFVLAGP
eukprot:749835-Pelagomonas_calceolata.AAC.6